MTEYWIVTKIVMKCPRCGNEYIDEGDNTNNIFRGKMVCGTCGFRGKVGEV